MSLIGTGTPIGRPAGLETNYGKKDNSGNSDVLDQMRKRYEHVCQAEDENRLSYVKSVRISSTNNQWDEEVKKRRGSNRPALTFNLLNLVVKQIIGDYRQNKMAIKVLPSGGPATEDIADILAGIIRNIEMDSNADEAYTNGLECSARGNIGAFRILPEYESDDVFTQKLKILPIKNPLTVYFDPNAKLLTRHDAEYCLVTEMISKDEFRKIYPKAEEMGWDIVAIDADGAGDWGDNDRIRLCEYFTKERYSAKLVAFDNGAVIQIDEPEEIEALMQIGIKPVKERQAERIHIKWRKCNGSHVLEERIFKTKYIPIIPVLGEEVNIEGKMCLRSAVYYAIDAQHSYNYERSTAIEYSALTARAPWLVTQKQIEMWRDQWDQANNNPSPYLVHTPDPAMPNGPQRIEPPAPSAANMQNAQTASVDIQRTTGVFNAQIGEQSNIQSGVGLSEQQSQGQTSTFIFLDNLRSSIEHCGRVLIDWIPEFYDTDRTVRTINSEDDIEMQRINEKKENPLLGVTEVLNDITVGEYDVIVMAGKAFASRRKEAVEGLINWAKAFPQQAPLVADQVLENMDVPGGEVMAERIKRSLPPQVVNDPDSPEGQKAAQQAQQQQVQQQQMQQQLIQGKLQVEEGKNQASMAKSSADVQKANAEVIKAKSDIEIAAIEAHNAKIETALHVLDSTRQNTEAPPSSPGSNSVMPQPSVAPGGAANAGVPQQAPAVPDETKKMLAAIAGHLVTSHKKHEEDIKHIHHAIGQIGQVLQKNERAINGITQEQQHGTQADLAQALATLARAIAAPTEAVRDNTGRITGSRKNMNG